MDYQQLFLDNLGLIDQVVRVVERRHRLSAPERDDFRGLVHLKLVENDYAILRKFEGRSSLSTFLTTVISRLFLDERIARWGKWRPSAAARRLGPVAILLEQLISRDGMSFDVAVETIRTNHRISVTETELAEMRQWVSVRAPRREASEDELNDIASSEPPLDQIVMVRERAVLAEKVTRSLTKAIEGLDPQDVLILRMLFLDRFPMSLIARTLGLDQKPLYRRREKVMERLRQTLEAEGLSGQDVLSLIGAPDVDLGSVFNHRSGNV